MKKFFGFLVIIVAAAACKSHSNLSSENLQQYFKDSMIHNPNVTVDSFGLVKVDTITAKKVYGLMDSTITMISLHTQKEIQEIQDTLTKETATHKAPAARLHADSLMLQRAQSKYTASLNDLHRLDSLITHADSVTTLAYIARCRYRLGNTGSLSVTDDVTINLDKNLNYLRKAQLKALMPVFVPTSWQAPHRQPMVLPHQ